VHFHCEVIMPPTDNPESAVGEIMKPFYEGDEENSGAFWDWWVIGGRYSGRKEQAKLDRERVQAFMAELARRKVTVSGVTAGKQSLQPASQIPAVDSLWREWFPESTLETCPLFEHSGDRMVGDISPLVEVPRDMECVRVIIAGPHWRDPERLEAKWMACEDFWNGVNHLRTTWDRTIRHALAMYDDYRQGRAQLPATDDRWLAVTVDYHT
jgi:hypothetical protein